LEKFPVTDAATAGKEHHRLAGRGDDLFHHQSEGLILVQISPFLLELAVRSRAVGVSRIFELGHAQFDDVRAQLIGHTRSIVHGMDTVAAAPGFERRATKTSLSYLTTQ
jgi:hypothetical protein